ncbi:MAG: metallophosphoesterase family protein, partial [Acetobacteraceae bacterium]
GHSFPNRAVPEDLSAGYPRPIEGMFNIGVLHTSAEDPGPHELYAPCRVGELALKGYDYWALGHIHARRVLAERPWILFPGNLQGRHAGEPGAKGCTLVTVEDRKVTEVAHRVVDVLRWVALDIDATGADPATLAGRISNAVLAALATADERPLLARLTFGGTADTAGALLADHEQLAAVASNAAIEAGGELWVESTHVHTRAAPAATSDMLAPLRALFLAGLDDDQIVRALLQDLAALAQKLPAPARKLTPLPEDAATLRALADEAWQLAANAIIPGGET